MTVFAYQFRAAEVFAPLSGHVPEAALQAVIAFMDDRDLDLERHLATAMPVGAIIDYPGTTPPTGWLKCDGSLVSRTTYSGLFAVTGTTWGVGDGTTTFELPTIAGDDADTIKVIRY